MFLLRSKHEEIELVPVDDFYRDAPEEVSRCVSCLVLDACVQSLFSFAGFVVVNGGKKWMCVLKLKPVLFKKKII